MKLWLGSTLLLFCFCLNAHARISRLKPNQMRIDVGGGAIENYSNIPLVSVTICQPGTDNCQTVNRIELDTGSVGLRLFSSLTKKLNLPAIKGPANQNIFECTSYGGGDSYWGPIRRADVKLGQEVASNVRIQTWQNVPNGVSCPIMAAQPEAGQINGILGVSFAHDDCADVGTDKNCGENAAFHYYKCIGSRCSPLNNATSLAVSNPVLGLPHDNNGYVIDFPAVPAPRNSIVGTIAFGLNSRKDNELGPAAAHELPVPANGWFHLKYHGQIYPSRFDTGADTYDFPAKFGLPMCDYLCPDQPTTIHLSVLTGDKINPFNIEITSPEEILNDSNVQVVPDMANLLLGSPFLMGMPFFYGKRVFFGLDRGANSPGFVAF